MTLNLLLLTSILFIGFIIVLYLLLKKSQQKQSVDPMLLEWMKSMQTSVDTTQKILHETLHSNSQHLTQTLQENTKQLNERMDKAAQALSAVNKEVGKMSEIGRNMQELQDFLKSPKLRGNIGEQVLQDLIRQIFPKNSFHIQYAFQSGEKVDAAIQTDAGILPIDAKFPAENFQKMVKAENEEERQLFRKEFVRDVKKHIESISKKYIVPSEGTMDFALMYVPSETVFYEIVCIDDMLEFARTHRVYLVSPSTLYAHLQTILLSFEGKKIETKSKELFAIFRSLKIDYEKIDDSLQTLGKHITNASNQYNNVLYGFDKMGKKLSSSQQITYEEKQLLEETV
ncbi:MAG TPA: DNA recombination protein RmuC [Patescibacteria group bacterium]|nr:DNA recombination protein RmuC [Patescibacteria group bacterium]